MIANAPSSFRKCVIASLVLLIALVSTLVYGAQPAQVPATLTDPQATAATRSLMARLIGEYGKRTWSGQYGSNETAHILQTSGLKPVIFGDDFMDYSPTRVAFGNQPTNLTESCIARARTGQIITMSWHWNAPANLLNTTNEPWWKGFYTKASTFDVAATLADTNSVQYAGMIRDIDAIAVQLKKFSDADVPILWRPLHEADGGWFWWGAKGPQPFKALWHLLYDRLTVHHQLHNLIWVYTGEKPDWYPGNDVVDIVGADAYPKVPGDILLPEWEKLKIRFDGVKPIALTEFGGVPDIESMQASGIWWCYFVSWTWNPTNPPPAASILRAYQSPSVITLNQPPATSESK